jgi:zinc transport system substrate-binding protein
LSAPEGRTRDKTGRKHQMASKEKNEVYHLNRFLVVLLTCAVILPGFCMSRAWADESGRIKAFVSILPQAYFVERIGGDRVEVEIMVGPGQSPATYEPTPQQMVLLSKADLYFAAGVPFERRLVSKISRSGLKSVMVDTQKGVDLRHISGREHDSDNAHGEMDPHIWLDPQRVKIITRNICDELVRHDPGHKEQFERNLKEFHAELDELDGKIARLLAPFKGSEFFIFHPVMGYFADRYSLIQTAVEVEGKEPSAHQLIQMIEKARARNVKIIFVQPQFSSKSAEAIAKAIRGRVSEIDPLARDYLANMEDIAVRLAEGLKQE